VDVKHVELLDPHRLQAIGRVADDVVLGHLSGAEAADEFSVDGELRACGDGADACFAVAVEARGVEILDVEGEQGVEDLCAGFGGWEFSGGGEAGGAEDDFGHDGVMCACSGR
jgi:hypothetical protein